MDKISKKNKLVYYKFLNSLPKKINHLYFSKLKGRFKLSNKSKKAKGFDPVTNIDKIFELFWRFPPQALILNRARRGENSSCFF